MYALADFFNHGTLPFVGREIEIARIIDFWRGTFAATELRAMLITGEGGIGKSRLLEHTMTQIIMAGGSIVHVKLYPESTASFIALVARALRHPNVGLMVMAEEVEPSVGTVSDAMRRLARLRPTLFVLEDLHLLGSEAVLEFIRLLNLLTDETISLLALARPVELEARGALEPYLIDDLVLSGLGLEECARIWKEVSGVTGNHEVAVALHDATLGNPLALRSALRGILKSADAAGKQRMAGATSHALALAGTLKRTVGLLAEGMTAHLTAEELKGARYLAMLGEVFSREAAEIMIDDADTIINALLFKGIISTVVASPDPLPGEPSTRPPLGFTHTLLHRQLIDHPSIDAGRLVRVIADRPLYSILPFRLLAGRSWGVGSLDTTTIGRAFDRTFKVQIVIRQSAQWRRTEQTWTMAVRLVASGLGRWQQDDWERMLIKLANHKLDLVRQEPMHVREHWMAYLSLLTADATSDEMIKGRLVALFHRELLYARSNPGMTRDLWDEAEALVAPRPHLRLTFPYADYIIAACVGASDNNDEVMMRRIEQCADTLLASSDLPAPIRRIFERKVRPPLLKLFGSEEELRARLAQVAGFEHTVEKNDISVWKFCVDLLGDVAAVDMLAKTCDSVIPLMREQGMTALLADTVARQCRVLLGTGESFDSIMLSFETAMNALPQWRRAQVQSTVASPLIDAALLCRELEWAHQIIKRYEIAEDDLTSAQWILLALHTADPRTVLLAGRAEECEEKDVAVLLDLVRGITSADHDVIVSMLRTPVLRLADLPDMLAAVGMIELARDEKIFDSIPPVLADAITNALNCSLEWLADAERELFAFMGPLLDRARPYFSARRTAAWQKKIDALTEMRGRKQQTVEGRLRLSMLGTIMAHMPDGRQQRFQGGRARMLLTMMVINRMLNETLSPAEFCRLAAGGEMVELENARDMVKTTVHRLRELIGRDAILTDGQSPRLNPDIVDVDLLEAHMLLKRAAEAMHRSSPMQAKGALIAALEISRGEVPFPSLYDEMVEAMREDFENKLRMTTIDVAAALAREGGTDDAVEVLRLASNAIPGDEELAELLRNTLVQAGRRAEAEVARIKAEVV